MIDPGHRNLPSLPHGARRLAVGDLTIGFAHDKIVVPLPGLNRHITLHAGRRSGWLDIHETIRTRDGEQHETLLRISHDKLNAMLLELMRPTNHMLAGVIRRLRPGWMVRRCIGAVYGLSVGDEDLEKVTVVKRRKLQIDPELLAGRVSIPEYVEEFYDLPDGASFTLFSWRCPTKPARLGIGFKISRPDGRPQLVWVRDRDLVRGRRELQRELLQLAQRYGEFVRPLPWF